MGIKMIEGHDFDNLERRLEKNIENANLVELNKKIIQKNAEQWDVWIADLPLVSGSIQHGVRPVIIVSNNMNNKYSTILTVISVTTSKTKSNIPTHLYLAKDISNKFGMKESGTILCEQPLTISKDSLKFKVGAINILSVKINILKKIIIQFVGSTIMGLFKDSALEKMVLNAPKYID